MSSLPRRVAALSIVCHQLASYLPTEDKDIARLAFGHVVRTTHAVNETGAWNLIACCKDLLPEGQRVRRVYRLLHLRLTATYLDAINYVGWIADATPNYRQAKQALDRIEGYDHRGQTELFRNAVIGYWKPVERLLTLGADPNVIGPEGWTPLMWAAHGGYTETVIFLVAARARLDLKNNKGLTALVMAGHQSHADIVQLLKEASSA